MERVLIVAKTRISSGVCVSGLTRSSKSIRLIPKGRFNQPIDTEFEVGQASGYRFQEVVEVDPPHVEDVIIINKHYKGHVDNLRQTLMNVIQPWHGGPENLFDKMLTIEGRKCYVPKSGPIPSCSTGYWLPDRQLTLDRENNKLFYLIEYADKAIGTIFPRTLAIPFVGLRVSR